MQRRAAAIGIRDGCAVGVGGSVSLRVDVARGARWRAGSARAHLNRVKQRLGFLDTVWPRLVCHAPSRARTSSLKSDAHAAMQGYGKGGKGGGGKGGGGWRGRQGRVLPTVRRGGRGRRCRGGGGAGLPTRWPAASDDAPERPAASLPDLQAALRRIDGRPYPAYRDLEHTDFEMGRFTLRVDGVQADPFAPPSRCHVRVPLPLAGFPADCLQPKVREVALRDFLTRQFCAASKQLGADQRKEEGGWGGSKGGELLIDLPGQHVLERTSVQIVGDAIEARFCVALPARGRTILGEWASQILTETLPSLVHASLYHAACDAKALKAHLDAVEDHGRRAPCPRPQPHRLCRRRRNPAAEVGPSTAARPRRRAVRPPPELAVELALPNAGAVRGMGIRRGVTLVAGGGHQVHLLEAMQLGVYDQLPGDGRERVVTDGDAVKVRAEDGRAVTSVDISTFIDNLPYGRKTNAFTSADASGSTSQAAAIVEAVQAGASALLIDEDTSATNFMIRDARMQRLVAADREPIKPFIAHVRRLWTERQCRRSLWSAARAITRRADTVLLMIVRALRRHRARQSDRRRAAVDRPPRAG